MYKVFRFCFPAQFFFPKTIRKRFFKLKLMDFERITNNIIFLGNLKSVIFLKLDIIFNFIVYIITEDVMVCLKECLLRESY